jgi:hypothetical protein
MRPLPPLDNYAASGVWNMGPPLRATKSTFASIAPSENRKAGAALPGVSQRPNGKAAIGGKIYEGNMGHRRSASLNSPLLARSLATRRAAPVAPSRPRVTMSSSTRSAVTAKGEAQAWPSMRATAHVRRCEFCVSKLRDLAALEQKRLLILGVGVVEIDRANQEEAGRRDRRRVESSVPTLTLGTRI